MSEMESIEHSGAAGATARPVTAAQQTAARIVGALYVLTMATAVFGQTFVRDRLIVADAAQTVTNIVASERLFRLGLVADLVTHAGVVVLLWALYVVLEPIHRNLALLAAFWRLIECAVAAGAVLSSFVAVRLALGGDFLQAVEPATLQALTRLFGGIHGSGLGIAFVFLGLGSALYSWLWLRSRYIPRAIAVLGIFSSLLLAGGSLYFMVFPQQWTMAFMMPMGLYEVGLGIWLLVRGLR